MLDYVRMCRATAAPLSAEGREFYSTVSSIPDRAIAGSLSIFVIIIIAIISRCRHGLVASGHGRRVSQ